MNTDLDFERELRQIARALVADAPDVPAFQRRLAIAEHSPRRFVPLTAAAAVVAVGVAGLVVAGNSGDNDPGVTTGISSPATDERRVPTMFPVIDDLPDNAAAELMPDEFLASDTEANAAALIGEMSADGTVLSTLTVRAGVRLGREFQQRLGLPVAGVEAFGVAATLYENTETGGPTGSRTIMWGTPPYFHLDVGTPYISLTGQPAIAGADPEEFLEIASPEFVTFTVADEAGPVEMTIGDLPEGFELLAGPQSLGGSARSTSAILRLTPSGSFVETSTFDPLIGNVGALDPVDIGGQPGWVNEDDSVVVWKVDESTWARAVALQAGNAVALAESVTFVDEATWTEMYDPQPSSTGPEFVPITGPIEYPDPSATIVPESVPVSMP